MAQALYRKWRPARFGEVVGQQHVTHTLQSAVAAGRLGQAYLFSGPRGTGKTTVARLVAKAANCREDKLAQRPCNRCAPCMAVNEGRFLDLIEIDAASNTGVDDIRDLRDKINFSPSEGQFKVYIIDEVHMLSPAAFNALLKTIEEPPPHAIFVLATTEEHKVPLTIKSRCQQFNFRLLTNREIVSRLTWLIEQENLSIEPQAIGMIAQHAAGSLRDAESLLDQLVAAPGETITLERAQMVLGTASDEAINQLTEAFITGDGTMGLGVIHQALGSGADARQFARQMVSYLRQLLLLQAAGPDLPLEATAEQRETMQHYARQVERQLLIEAVKRFNEAATAQSGTWQPQLPLELAFIELLPEAGSPVDIGTFKKVTEASAEPVSQPETIPAPKEVIEELAEKRLAENEEESAKPEPVTVEALPGLSLSEVTSHWPQLREHVARLDKSLPALLASCKPLAVDKNVLILGFDYPILKEKFDKKMRAADTVAKALRELFDVDCLVQTVVSADFNPASTTTQINKDEFAALAEELGGVVRGSER